MANDVTLPDRFCLGTSGHSLFMIRGEPFYEDTIYPAAYRGEGMAEVVRAELLESVEAERDAAVARAETAERHRLRDRHSEIRQGHQHCRFLRGDGTQKAGLRSGGASGATEGFRQMTDEQTRATFAHADALMSLKKGDMVRLKDEAYLAWIPRKDGWDDWRVPDGSLLRVVIANDAPGGRTLTVETALGDGGLQTLHIWPQQFGLVEIVERAG